MIKIAFKTVFREKRYMVAASVIAVVLFILSTWLVNLRLIFTILASSEATLSEKMGILVSLTGSIGTNFTLFSASYTILIALLFGINIAMIIFYMKRNKKLAGQDGMMSLGGLTSGVFGVGCAACGTLVIGPLLAFVGAAGLVSYLPFAGEEFGILAVLMLSFSIYLIAKKISKPAACKVIKK